MMLKHNISKLLTISKQNRGIQATYVDIPTLKAWQMYVKVFVH